MTIQLKQNIISQRFSAVIFTKALISCNIEPGSDGVPPLECTSKIVGGSVQVLYRKSSVVRLSINATVKVASL